MKNTQEFPWATAMMTLIAVIVVLIGGLVVIFDDDTLGFAQYIDTLAKLSVGVGILGVGRGVRSGLLRHRQGRS